MSDDKPVGGPTPADEAELPPVAPEDLPLPQWPGDPDSYCAHQPYTDLGNARRLRARFGADLRCVRYHGWHAWDGRRWQRRGGEDSAIIWGQETARLIRREPAFWSARAKEAVEKGEGERVKAFGSRAEASGKHAVRSEAHGAVSAMLASVRPHLTCDLDDMDQHADLLVVDNGTIELGVRPRLRAARREELLTRLAPVAYDEQADFPLWREFLHTILPDDEVREFVHRWFGYCLTGHVHEQVLTIFHGTGANGKSTMVDTLRWVLGDYAVILPFSSLLADDRRRGGEATPDLARLPGARLVTASEPELGRAFSEAVVKTLTGEGRITARHLREEFFEFTPQFKLTLSCNNKPTVRGTDEGTWRRVLLVPFSETIPREERDKQLPERLRGEASGILNWLVQGAALYAEHGLAVPERVRMATGDYRDESDPMGSFLRSWVVTGEHAYGRSIRAGELYHAYLVWCEGNMISPLSQQKFGRKMGDRGYRKEKVSSWFYPQMHLTEEAEKAVREHDHAAATGQSGKTARESAGEDAGKSDT